jgi:acyl phosphate:glycerol-3-phosphate acyltransferase
MNAVSILCAYLIGSVPFALLVARRWGAGDLRRIGSGNIGAANVLRASGATAGMLVALLDIGKGAASVLLAEQLDGSVSTAAAAGLAAIAGHVYPVWLWWHGGKGVATACGVFSVLAPTATLLAVVVFVGGVWLTRYVSLGSVLSAVALPPLARVLGGQTPVVVVATAAAALIVFRHRSNLVRLWWGTERRIGTGV